MKLKTLATIVQAAHYTYLVDGDFQEPGGIMLVAPPGSFKTQIVNSLETHERALVLSDVNVTTINQLRRYVSEHRLHTLAFTEFEKLYQRDPKTAINIEGHIRAFVDEGFRHASFENAMMVRRKATCMVIGACTTRCYENHYNHWEDSGFLRRFIMIHYILADPNAISNAMLYWKRINFGGLAILRMDGQGKITNNLILKERQKLQKMLPADSETPFATLQKIACILKCVYPNTFMSMLEELEPCLKQPGGFLELPNTEETNGKLDKSHNRSNSR